MAQGAEAVVDGLVVSNEGWEWQPLEGGAGTEEQSIRGFSVVRHQTEELSFEQAPVDGPVVSAAAAPADGAADEPAAVAVSPAAAAPADEAADAPPDVPADAQRPWWRVLPRWLPVPRCLLGY